MSRDPLPARAPQLKPFMVVTSIAVACSADQSVEEVCVKTAADHWIVGRKCGERPRPRGLSSCRPNALCAAHGVTKPPLTSSSATTASAHCTPPRSSTAAADPPDLPWCRCAGVLPAAGPPAVQSRRRKPVRTTAAATAAAATDAPTERGPNHLPILACLPHVANTRCGDFAARSRG